MRPRRPSWRPGGGSGTSRPRPPRDSGRLLLRQAWWRSVGQIAAATTVVVLLVGGVSLVLLNTGRSRAMDATLAAVLDAADDVGDPPPGSYLAHVGAGAAVEVTPGAPGPIADLLVATVRDPTTAGRDVTAPGAGEYRIRVTADRPDGQRWVVAADLTSLRADQRGVLQAVLLAEAAGLAGAIGAAALLSRRSVEPLARALELQRRFVADASHELRAPLTVLHTRTQILAADPTVDPDGPLGRGLHDLVTDTGALGEVIEDLLAGAELDRPPPTTPVDLDALAAAVVAGMAGYAHERGVTLDHVRCTPDDGPVVVTGHRTALRRAVTALVDNAIGHTERHGHVLVRTGRHDRHPAVTVTDDGIGFDPADTEQIFTRSHHRPRGDRPRFGLGLALVREIAHAHGGTITATARPGRGACFTLTLT